jgi:hypothetical protein
LSEQITDQAASEEELTDQLSRLNTSLEESRSNLSVVQLTLDLTVAQRRDVYESRTAIENRLVEIEELLERFALLDQHYGVDKERLRAIQESGSKLALAEKTACPLCGASPEHQHLDHACDGKVEAIVEAATSTRQPRARTARDYTRDGYDRSPRILPGGRASPSRFCDVGLTACLL